jgi:hypothetical protein
MNIFIYQIGYAHLGVTASSVAGLEIELPKSFRGEVRQTPFKPGISFSNLYQLPEAQELTISGSIIPKPSWSINDQLAMLESVGGHPMVDVIAYLPEIEPLGCSDCFNPGCTTWITTVGQITSITPTFVIDGESAWPTEVVECEIEMILSDYWMPLNPWLWEAYHDGGQVSGLRQVVDAYKSPVPCSTIPFSPRKSNLLLWNKKNYKYPFDLYDIAVWENTPNARGRGWGDWSEYMVGGSIRKWNAPPTSNYQFTNMPTSGTITIDVASEFSAFSRVDHTSTIDLAELNTQLVALGYTGIEEADILIATDSIYAPSVYVRDGAILDVHPIWLYEYAYVGQFLGPLNHVSITAPEDVLSAHLHVYRML